MANTTQAQVSDAYSLAIEKILEARRVIRAHGFRLFDSIKSNQGATQWNEKTPKQESQDTRSAS